MVRGRTPGLHAWSDARRCVTMDHIMTSAPVSQDAVPATDWVPRKATRDTQDLLLGGVAGGLARHMGIKPLVVRAFFVLAALMLGLGVILYAVLWLLLPTDEAFEKAAPGVETASRRGMRPGRIRTLRDVGPAVAVGVFGLGAALLLTASFDSHRWLWPLLIGACGMALLWRQADEVQRRRWIDADGRMNLYRAVFADGGWASFARVAAGFGLLAVAASMVLVSTGSLYLARDMAVAGLFGVAIFAIVIGPWIYRLASDLTAERAERVRTQERADVAAHLHDSVLQTLALIQKNSGNQPVVARLARAQERDLRAWLYSASGTEEELTLAGQLRASAAAIEDAHGISVDVVTVGDTDFAEALRPVADAAGEAVTNAAKHSGSRRVDVYAEISADTVDVFVRDRGVGFDPSAVAEDRLGVRRSIIDRMERHGGSAEIRSDPGAGTEVRLHLPLNQESG